MIKTTKDGTTYTVNFHADFSPTMTMEELRLAQLYRRALLKALLDDMDEKDRLKEFGKSDETTT